MCALLILSLSRQSCSSCSSSFFLTSLSFHICVFYSFHSLCLENPLASPSLVNCLDDFQGCSLNGRDFALCASTLFDGRLAGLPEKVVTRAYKRTTRRRFATTFATILCSTNRVWGFNYIACRSAGVDTTSTGSHELGGFSGSCASRILSSLDVFFTVNMSIATTELDDFSFRVLSL